MIINNNFIGTLFCEGYKKDARGTCQSDLNMLQSKSCLLALSDISHP